MNSTARTKIVATVGPASWDVEMLKTLVQRGVDVFRINTAHGDRASHQETLDRIRQAERMLKVSVSVLVDLAGPKIRLNQLEGMPIELVRGQSIRFEQSDRPLTSEVLCCNFPGLVSGLNLGDSILLSDGLIKLSVVEKQVGAVVCNVENGGQLRGRQGVNVPGAKLTVSALSEKDVENARWAASQQVEFVSLSFVRTAIEVQELKNLVAETNPSGKIVAKIEKPEALENLQQIVEASDAIMVARGDLGVEIDIERTPLAQKRIVRMCHRLGRPVIVATQMLESMHTQPRPTRAEVSDVANAILDGADACMLSGETAVGSFPESAVGVMNRIMLETESDCEFRIDTSLEPLSSDVALAMARGAAGIAKEVNAKVVVMISDRTAFAKSLSRLRVAIPTVALTSKKSVAGALNLCWGIVPVVAEQEILSDLQKFKEYLFQIAGQKWGLTAGDKLVLVKDGQTAGEETWMTVITL